MKRSTRVWKAQETLAIIKNGHYEAGGKRIDIAEALAQSRAGSRLYAPNDFTGIENDVQQQLAVLQLKTSIDVCNCSVLEAAASLQHGGNVVGCLNFASAKNPGGGFLNGAVAQEESLALSSSLHDTQWLRHQFYDYNRSRATLLYSDYTIWSPDTVMFRDDDGELLEHPYPLSIITSPAVNVGAIITNKRDDDLQRIEEASLQRMDRVLSLFVLHGIRRVLLGAWGCGVFRNDPSQMAGWFAHYLLPGGKYAACFEEVVFAVYDRGREADKFRAFQHHLAP